MRINLLKFENKVRAWTLETLALNELTLLVGASGVGKTQILKAILALKDINLGKSINGAKWYVDFQTTDQHYIWEGQFESIENAVFWGGESTFQPKAKILYEKLFYNDKLIVERDAEHILFLGKPTIKLSPFESVLSLLDAENLIAPAHAGLNQIVWSDQANAAQAAEIFTLPLLTVQKIVKQYDTYSKIQLSDLNTILKLFLISKVSKKADKKWFQLIKTRFMDIFPQVEDLKIAPLEYTPDMPDFLKEYPFIQIKEIGVEKWISQPFMSSGMYRTLLQISELYLSSEGTVFLIDEFENSLGINCINELTSAIQTTQRKLQFILTSHHPYIINNIPFEHWKLVTRQAGVVKTHPATDFHLGNSKHEAFMQLIQLDEYKTGREDS
jgi:ABC-type transport system involved in cytochrome c biogenesis ATPase subunit